MTPLNQDDLLKEIYEKLSTMQGDVRVLTEQISGKNGLMVITLRHEEEIQDLNKFRWKILGGAGVVATLVSAFWAWVIKR